MFMQRGRLVSGGRLQVPADIRAALGIGDGSAVLLSVVDGELRVRPVHSALSRVQEELAQWLPADTSLSEELIADRRREAAGE